MLPGIFWLPVLEPPKAAPQPLPPSPEPRPMDPAAPATFSTREITVYTLMAAAMVIATFGAYYTQGVGTACTALSAGLTGIATAMGLVGRANANAAAATPASK